MDTAPSPSLLRRSPVLVRVKRASSRKAPHPVVYGDNRYGYLRATYASTPATDRNISLPPSLSSREQTKTDGDKATAPQLYKASVSPPASLMETIKTEPYTPNRMSPLLLEPPTARATADSSFL